MLKYYFEFDDVGEKLKYHIHFEDDYYYWLEGFLNNRGSEKVKEFKDFLDLGISGEEKYNEIGVYYHIYAVIGFIRTKIRSELGEESEICAIDTWIVRYLLDVWDEERQRYMESERQVQDGNAGLSGFQPRSPEEINRAYSILEDDVLNEAADEDARIYLKILQQADRRADRIHKIFDSAKQAAAAKGKRLTEEDVRYINKVYFVNQEKDVPQKVINDYMIKASRGSDFSALKNTEQYFDQDTLEYIFEGGLDDTARAVGYHYHSSKDTIGGIIPGHEIRTGKFGVYQAEVQVAGIQKSGGSSFFPNSMSKQDVIDAINEAYANKVPFPDEDSYLAVTNRGMKIMMHLKKNGKIKAAYPLYEEGTYIEL